ncbi:sugar ABC transporter permease [Methyloprofundus sedimenti]|uniref:Sugar ABC transporter permease n=1 Tax=Methyloprofundus sedimenti TaxID=1420851 RepID=A0A1V8MAM9_9GAMM|nr:carbohydrate ABC transporter permease [Methyloprofundus sedimenti]OQK18615.1 sugar ABC transporter permease [Methyloprofundus sedimenti]
MQQSARNRVVNTVIMLLTSLIFVAPLLFMISSSFKPDAQIFEDLRSFNAFLPTGDISLMNYHNVFAKSQLLRYFLNSAFIAGTTVCLGIVINSMAAYSLQRLNWKGRHLTLSIILALLVIPFEVVAIPLMLISANLPWIGFENGQLMLQQSWFNSLHVQIIPFIANAFCIFLFYQFFKDIPKELDEAAKMDGAGVLRIYSQIIMPNSKPVIATSAIILFLSMWNQYLWPILVIQGQEYRPVMPGIQQFFGHTNSWGEIMAYATLITLPVLLVFIFFQRRFVESVVSSGIKG